MLLSRARRVYCVWRYRRGRKETIEALEERREKDRQIEGKRETERERESETVIFFRTGRRKATYGRLSDGVSRRICDRRWTERDDDVGANSRRKTYKQSDSFREEATGGLVSRITLCQMPIIFTRRWAIKKPRGGGNERKVSANRCNYSLQFRRKGKQP